MKKQTVKFIKRPKSGDKVKVYYGNDGIKKIDYGVVIKTEFVTRERVSKTKNGNVKKNADGSNLIEKYLREVLLLMRTEKHDRYDFMIPDDKVKFAY